MNEQNKKNQLSKPGKQITNFKKQKLPDLTLLGVRTLYFFFLLAADENNMNPKPAIANPPPRPQ